MRKRVLEDNLKTYALKASNMSWVPTNSTIAVTFNPIMSYLRHSEADILFWDNHTYLICINGFLAITQTNNAIAT